MATEVTIALATANSRVWNALIEELKLHFNKVTEYKEDLIIVCQTNKDTDYFAMSRMTYNFREYIDDIAIRHTEERPVEEFSHDYEFVSAYDLINKEE